MIQNQLSRYGAISRNIPDLAPGSKVFLVSDSDDTTVGPVNLGAEFPVDKDGVVRVYTTIQAAVNAASAGRGDIVQVLPGYDQSLTAADSWATAGVQIIGMGNGNNRPTIRYTGASGEVGLGANNVRVSNLRFLTALTAVTRGLDLDTGFFGQKVDNCLFSFNATGNDFITCVRVGSKNSIVEDNVFSMEDTTGHNYAISLLGGDPDFAVIRNNTISGNFDSSVIGQDTSDTSDTNLIGVQINGNFIENGDTAAAMHIRASAGYTVRGIAANNRIASFDTSVVLASQFAAPGVRFVNTLARSDSSEATI